MNTKATRWVVSVSVLAFLILMVGIIAYRVRSLHEPQVVPVSAFAGGQNEVVEAIHGNMKIDRLYYEREVRGQLLRSLESIGCSATDAARAIALALEFKDRDFFLPVLARMLSKYESQSTALVAARFIDDGQYASPWVEIEGWAKSAIACDNPELRVLALRIATWNAPTDREIELISKCVNDYLTEFAKGRFSDYTVLKTGRVLNRFNVAVPSNIQQILNP